MESIVVDTNVLVASSLESEPNHLAGQTYIDGLEAGDWVFHLPMLVVVEVMATVNRRVQRSRLALLATWDQTFVDWERDGKIILYQLDRPRMDRAIAVAQRDHLRGPDSVIAALADELGIPLKTFDNEIIERFHLATP